MLLCLEGLKAGTCHRFEEEISSWGPFCSSVIGSWGDTSMITFQYFSPCCCPAAREACIGFLLQQMLLLWIQLFPVMGESRGHLPQWAGLLLPLGCCSAPGIPPLSPQWCCCLESRGAAGLWFSFISLGGVLPSNIQWFIIWLVSCNTLAAFKMYIAFCAIC